MSDNALSRADRPLADETDAPEDDDLAAFSEQARLCFAVYSAHHAFNRVYQPLLSDLGLTYPQYLVMAALWARDGRPVGEIAETLRLETSTLTPLLKRMEVAGLLSRARSMKDERVVTVTLTAAGRELRDRARGVPACIFKATGMTLEDLDRLYRDINGLRDALEAADPRRMAADPK